jgi:hypothetical protein
MKKINASKSPSEGESSGLVKERKAAPNTMGEKVRQAPVEARKTAAVVLEVLAGVRTPAEAAKELALSPACYYLLEARAMAGLLEACRPKEMGRAKSPDRELAMLRKEKERMQREIQRLIALQRITRRAMGVAHPSPDHPQKAGGCKERKKRKKVRALRAAKIMKNPVPVNQDVPSQSPSVSGPSETVHALQVGSSGGEEGKGGL